MRKTLVSFVAGTFLFGAAVFLFSLGKVDAAVGGPICNVPADYPTIQAAVSVPGCTTVNVAAGTYTENVTISHSLTLNGAQTGVDARSSRGTESIINGGTGADITITADNVIVDGFTLDGPSNSGLAALVMQTGNSGETIKNNIINNPGRAASITTSNTVFEKNAVRNTSTATDGFQANSTPIHTITFADNNFGGATPANYNADITIIEGNSNVIVSGNSSNGDGTLIALFKTTNAEITDNTVVGGGGSSAIYIGGANSNVTVKNNHVTSAGAAVKVANFYGDGVNTNVSITKNILKTSQYGVYVTAPAVTNASTVVAKRNNVSSNSLFGIDNEATGSINGTCNWWGASNGPGPVGPGSGDKVSTNVNFSSWLLSSDLNGQCAGGNVATTKADCYNGEWKTHVRSDESTFDNQGQCIDYVVKHEHKINGDVSYTAYGLDRHAEFNMNTSDNKKGTFNYSDANGGSYTVDVSSVKVSGNKGWFAGEVTKASDPSWIGQWLFAEVKDNHPDQIWGSFTDQATAQAGVTNMTNPADGPFNVTKGSLEVN